jgi:hypothetical protein
MPVKETSSKFNSSMVANVSSATSMMEETTYTQEIKMVRVDGTSPDLMVQAGNPSIPGPTAVPTIKLTAAQKFFSGLATPVLLGSSLMRPGS